MLLLECYCVIGLLDLHMLTCTFNCILHNLAVFTIRLFSPCSNCDSPQLIESLKGKKVVDVACGASHSGCILDDGTLYTWGKGRYGRLGHNDHEPQYRPKQVSIVLTHRLILMSNIL